MVIQFSVKNMVILDSGGNYLHVKEVANSFTKIGAPYPPKQAVMAISTNLNYLKAFLADLFA